MSFELDISRFAEKTKSNLSQAVRAIKIDLFTGVIMDTRVDTGRARGNWITTTGTPSFNTIERLDKESQGQPGGEAYNEVIATITPDGVDYLCNNLPYAGVLEGWDGMIEKNMVRIDRIVRNAVK